MHVKLIKCKFLFANSSKCALLYPLGQGRCGVTVHGTLPDPDTQKPAQPLGPAHANVHDNNHKIQVDCPEGCLAAVVVAIEGCGDTCATANRPQPPPTPTTIKRTIYSSIDGQL